MYVCLWVGIAEKVLKVVRSKVKVTQRRSWKSDELYSCRNGRGKRLSMWSQVEALVLHDFWTVYLSYGYFVYSHMWPPWVCIFQYSFTLTVQAFCFHFVCFCHCLHPVVKYLTKQCHLLTPAYGDSCHLSTATEIGFKPVIAFFMIHAIRRANNRVYRMHPCLTPVFTANHSFVAPPYVTEPSAVHFS